MHNTPMTFQKDVFTQNLQPQHPHQRCTTAYRGDMDRSQQIPQKFLGQIILDVNHKTTGTSYPTRFYIFKDTTSLLILIFYAESDRLGILWFNLPNENASAQLDTVTVQLNPWKHITFSTTDTIIPLSWTISMPHSKTMIQKLLGQPHLSPHWKMIFQNTV